MNEFDFEELDKAVNSLMSKPSAQNKDNTESNSVAQSSEQVGSNAPASMIDEHTPAAQSEGAALPVVDESPSIATPQEVKETSIQPAISSSPATPNTTPTVKRSGRFMDVVHPSSDMRSTATLEPPTSRQGVAIQPLAPASSSAEVVAEPIEEPASNAEAPVLNTGTFGSDSFSSPFLPDTQVEKRPLGGFSQDDTQEVATKEVAENQNAAHLDADLPLEPLQPKVDLASELAKEDVQEEGTSDRPTDIDTPVAEEKPFMPEELHSDLVAIEANELQEQTQDSTTVEATEPVVEVSPEVVVPAATETAIVSEPEQPEPVIGSIPQQYQEQVSSVESVHTPVYAESSAQPVAVAPKKKSWVLIALILLIAILLAVAVAAGLFFAGLI